MAGRGTDIHDVLMALQDIRLPAEAPGGLLAEVAVALGLGLCLAVALSVLLTAFTRRSHPQAAAPGLEDRLAGLRTLPEPERTLALLHLARQRHPELRLPYASALYAPGGFPEAAEIESLIRHREAQDA